MDDALPYSGAHDNGSVNSLEPPLAVSVTDLMGCAGMQTVWVFGDAVDITGQVPEPYVSGYLTYGGSAYGNETYFPTVNHHFS